MGTKTQRRVRCTRCRRRADLILAAERPKEPDARRELARLRCELRKLAQRVARQDVGPYGIENALRGMLEE